MGPMAGFDSVAAYYEVLSDDEARLRREGPLLLECLDRAPGTRVVDLACGSGLHAFFFAEHGATVTALDISPGMIAYAGLRRAHPAIRYVAADMRHPEGGPWDLAVCLGNSLSLLPSFEDVGQALDAVLARLTPGGLLVAHVLNYLSAACGQARHRVERKTTTEGEIVAVKSLVPEGDRTLLSLAFFAVGEDGVHSATDTAVLLHLTPSRLVSLAERAGFQIEASYGGFDRAPYVAETSGDLIVVLRKPA